MVVDRRFATVEVEILAGFGKAVEALDGGLELVEEGGVEPEMADAILERSQAVVDRGGEGFERVGLDDVGRHIGRRPGGIIMPPPAMA